MGSTSDAANKAWESYKAIRNQYKKAIWDAKQKAWKIFWQNVASLSAVKKLHKLSNRSGVRQIDTKQYSDGSLTTSLGEALELLMDTHFQTSRVTNTYAHTSSSIFSGLKRCLVHELITGQSVTWSFCQFQPYKSSGPEGVLAVMLHHVDIETIK